MQISYQCVERDSLQLQLSSNNLNEICSKVKNRMSGTCSSNFCTFPEIGIGDSTKEIASASLHVFMLRKEYLIGKKVVGLKNSRLNF